MSGQPAPKPSGGSGKLERGKRRKERKGDETAFKRAVRERDHNVCQGSRFEDRHVCTGRLQVHHIKRRSQGGLNLPDNAVLICSKLHEYIHANPELARERGFLT